MAARRLVALLSTTAVVATALLLPAPAHADVLSDMTADVELAWTTVPVGPACTVSSAGPLQTNTPVPADGLPHLATITASVVATQGAGNTMTATLSEARTITATAVGGQLAHVLVQDSWSASFQAQGSGASCNLRLFLHGDTAGHFTRVQPAWVTVSATGRGIRESGGVTNDGVVVPGSQTAEVGATGGGSTGSTGSAQGLLPVQPSGGQLVVFPAQDSDVWAPGPGTPTQSQQGSGTVDLRLDVPGTSPGAESGKGRAYVDLAAAQDCATHTATATWRPKVGKGKESRVAKATFKVEKVTVGKARHPKKGTATTLKRLPPTGAVEVVATLRLASGKTVTVSRPYLPCG